MRTFENWDKDRFTKPIVLHGVHGDISNGTILEYPFLHPEEFDPNQLEYLKAKLLPAKEEITQQEASQ